MSDIYVGLKAQNIDIGAEMPDITGIRLVVDSDHEYVVGDAAGRMMEVECPWGTEAMAKSILETMSGMQYRPYTAERAMLDPAFEPGDSVMVCGVASAIINSDINYNGAALANIDAPALDEIDDEYPARQIKASSFERQLAYTRSLISKTVDSITLSVTDADGEVSIQLKAGDKELGKPGTIDLTGVVTFSALAGKPTGTTTINGGWIDADTLNVDAANISGLLNAGEISLYGDMTVYADEEGETIGGYIGYAESTLDNKKPGVHMTAEGYSGEVAVTQNGAKLLYGDDNNQIYVADGAIGMRFNSYDVLKVSFISDGDDALPVPTVKVSDMVTWDFTDVNVKGLTATNAIAVFAP